MNSRVTELYDPPIHVFKHKARALIDPRRPVLDMNQAVPGWLPPESVRRAMVEALDGRDYPFYTPDEGLGELRETIAREMERLYGKGFDVDNICVTSGANNAFYSALSVLMGCGDEVILPSPYYFNHEMAVRILGGQVREVPLDPEAGFPLPLEGIRSAVTPRTRAVVLVNPGNPTGRSYSQEDVTALYELCRECGIWLISDEVYNYFHPDYPEPASPLGIEGGLDRAVSLHSYSKTFSITGQRVGFIAASPEFLRDFLKVQDTNTICAPRLGQLGALAGLREARSWLEDKIGEAHRRSRLLEDGFTKMSPPFRILARGAFFLYLRHDFAMTSDEVCQGLIAQQNLVTLPGTCFGSSQDRSIRVALGGLEEEQIPLVLEKLSAFRI